MLYRLYWINNAVESKKEQFKNDVQKSLGSVSERINEKERSLFDKKFEGIIENAVLANEAQIKSLSFSGNRYYKPSKNIFWIYNFRRKF